MNMTLPPVAKVNAWSPAHVYISDPWHPAAHATIDNLFLEHLDPLRGRTSRGRVCHCVPTAIGTCSKIYKVIAVIEHFVRI